MSVATRRTFYIERYGNRYVLVKVWEVGSSLTKRDIVEALNRVLKTNPDERIIAEQTYTIFKDEKGIHVELT